MWAQTQPPVPAHGFGVLGDLRCRGGGELLGLPRHPQAPQHEDPDQLLPVQPGSLRPAGAAFRDAPGSLRDVEQLPLPAGARGLLPEDGSLRDRVLRLHPERDHAERGALRGRPAPAPRQAGQHAPPRPQDHPGPLAALRALRPAQHGHPRHRAAAFPQRHPGARLCHLHRGHAPVDLQLYCPDHFFALLCAAHGGDKCAVLSDGAKSKSCSNCAQCFLGSFLCVCVYMWLLSEFCTFFVAHVFPPKTAKVFLKPLKIIDPTSSLVQSGSEISIAMLRNNLPQSSYKNLPSLLLTSEC